MGEKSLINFNKPYKVFPFTIDYNHLSGDGIYTKKNQKLMEEKFLAPKVLLTTSCTDALEMSAILSNIKPGDEVIAPSYTFVSTVNAFVLRGAKVIFVDINPLTMNIDENLIEEAITPRTKAIIPVHYAGVASEMDKILSIASQYNLLVIEDAAQGVMAKYKGTYLGTLGDFGTYSFHETKNYTMGEGGALLVNNLSYIERAEIIREKGTNRSKFFRGQVDKYTWVDLGSSYLPSDINAAYLYPQIINADEIMKNRISSWNLYYANLKTLEDNEIINLPSIPNYCEHNAHKFYIKAKDLEERTSLIEFLKKNDIQSVFHYIPLHSSPAGLKFGRFHGHDNFTTKESERLLRLPMYYGLNSEEIEYITDKIKKFYNHD